MEMSRGRAVYGPAVRRTGLFLGSCFLFAAGTAWVGWMYLPYEALERFSPADQFQLWEGVVWLVALLFTFFGLASVIERTGWRLQAGLSELTRRFGSPEDGGALFTPATLPWWMMTCGVLLMLIGTLGRSMYAP